jgi:hypothetical protein
MKLLTLAVMLFFISKAIGQQPVTYTLVIGIQHVNDSVYAALGKSFSPEAAAGVNLDLDAISKIAEKNSDVVKTLKDTQATSQNILSTMATIGSKIHKGDTFLFYFTGHGDVVPDKNGDEPSGYDQALVAYDGLLIDDEIYSVLVKYFKEANNIMIIDACHSSTSYKIARLNFYIDLKTAAITKKASQYMEQQVKSQDTQLAACNLDAMKVINEAFNMIYFGATEDDGFAKGDRVTGGALTYCLYKIYKKANLLGTWRQYSYRRLACELAQKMADEYSQNLQYHEIGNNVPAFANNIPFKTK